MSLPPPEPATLHKRSPSSLARVRHVVEADLRPLAAKIDAEGVYPAETLKKLGAAGAFAQHHAGFGDAPEIDLALALNLLSAIAEACVSTAFCAWCHNAFGWYVQNTENANLRARLQADIASGARLSGTGLSNPMKALSGLEPLKLRGEKVAGGYRVNGLLPWVSNVEDGSCVAFAFALDDALDNARMAVGRLGEDGITGHRTAAFVALEGTATRAIGFKDAFVPEDMLLSDSFPRFARRIKPGFVLLQTGLAVGLLRDCAAMMRGLPAQLRAINALLPIGPNELDDMLGVLEPEIATLAQTPLEEDRDYRRRVLQARLDCARHAVDAAQALTLHAGASAFLRDSAANRRLREANFLAIVTPSTKHLLKDLAAI